MGGTALDVDVSSEIVIRRPLQIVESYASDPDNAPTWYVNIKAVEWQSPAPLRIGSQVAFIAHFLGRRLAYTYEIRELVPGRLLRMATADGPFPMETTYLWESTEAGDTRMVLRNRGRPAGFMRFLGPLLASAMRRANRKDLALLKEILEGR